MYQINNEKFGQFLAEVRKEKQMTQKDLADKLFVSDKTVSNWERGNSMPNVILLIPIADVLSITVTELLQGEKLKENKTLNSDVVETLVVNSLDLSLRDTIHQRKKNWIFAFLISIGVVVIEAILLTVSGISIEQMGDSLYISLLMLLFASWLCIFAKELLPTYYVERIFFRQLLINAWPQKKIIRIVPFLQIIFSSMIHYAVLYSRLLHFRLLRQKQTQK